MTRSLLAASLALSLLAPATLAQTRAPARPEDPSFRAALRRVLGARADQLLLRDHEVFHRAPPADEEPRECLEDLARAERAVWLPGVGPQEGPPGPEASRADLPHRPLTIVIFPGIFGEFIDERAMGEVFARDSALGRAWKERLGACAADPARAAAGRDESWDLRGVGPLERPLAELVSVASLDDADGAPVVGVVLLETPRYSLESTGPLGELSGPFTRRLTKALTLLEGAAPEELVFVGYSMGTPVALDVLAGAGAQPWAGRVRAVVSLSGVNWGSTAADVALAPDGQAPTARQLRLLKTLADELEVPTGLGLTARAQNVMRWLRFLRGIYPTLALPEGELPDPRSFRFGEARSLLDLVLLTALRTFTLGRVHSDHPQNVRRWKRLVERVLGGIGNLTTEARLEWWRTHALPAGLRCYSLPAVLVDGAPAVEAGSVDLWVNRNGQRDYVQAGGTPLNDGQVGLHQVRFLPGLAAALNPGQPPLQEELLGVLAAHHWSPTLRTGIGGVSPFPREGLLRALAIKAAWDLEGQPGLGAPPPALPVATSGLGPVLEAGLASTAAVPSAVPASLRRVAPGPRGVHELVRAERARLSATERAQGLTLTTPMVMLENGLRPGQPLPRGRALVIPAPGPRRTLVVRGPEGRHAHWVQEGESLLGLAQRYGVALADLLSADDDLAERVRAHGAEAALRAGDLVLLPAEARLEGTTRVELGAP